MIFYEEGHIYKDSPEGKIFTSVSQVLHSLEKVKNWKAIAKRYATKVGKTVAEVEADWKKENDKSVVRGKSYHTQKQTELLDVGVVHRKGKLCDVKGYLSTGQSSEIVQTDCKLENNTVYTEMMVWDETSGICGMADEIEIVDNTININDHKTNKEIKKEGFLTPQGREKLLSPVSHLDDCNWNKYCLQLSLYMYMLWKKNKHLKVGKLTLNHVEFDQGGKPTKVNPMDVPYLRDEVKAITEWWKTKQS